MGKVKLIRELISEIQIEIKADMNLINKYEIFDELEKAEEFKKMLKKDQAKLELLESKLAIELEKESKT